MARKSQDMASSANQQATAMSKDNQAKASGAYNQLFPQYKAEATNPTGFDPTTLSEMKTGSEESTGGATAGAVGQAGLQTARDRNSGGTDAVLDESARDAGRTNSANDLTINTGNSMLKESQRQQGLEGMNSMFNTETGAATNNLGQEVNAANAYTEAGKSGWFQNMLGMINALTSAGKAAFPKGFQQ